MKLTTPQLKRLLELLAPFRTVPITKPIIEQALSRVRSEVPA
ncbi:hypothetical protein [Halomonas sp. MS1]|nr:hypothetical protein [Halomonas sp. MS1]